ncbi:MAG: hypothetical protein LBD67_02965 [Candidatus Accumulibacter sp.]|nr:hypothetical protein [Accumulibacter sp.]
MPSKNLFNQPPVAHSRKEFPAFSSPYPSTSSGRTDWKRRSSTYFLRQAQDRQNERMGKTPSALSLLNHRQHLSPFVLVLPEHFDTLYPRSC